MKAVDRQQAGPGTGTPHVGRQRDQPDLLIDNRSRINRSFKLPLVMKVLHCKDVGFDCPGIIQAESETEVLQLAAQHAQEAHQVLITSDMAEQIKPLIHDLS